MEPLVSFVVPAKEKDFRMIELLKSIRNQNYPQNRIEILIIDGGSKGEILKESRKYNVRIYDNPMVFAEGDGCGKDQGIWRASGEFIIIAETDTELMGRNWLRNMLRPFKDEEVFAVIPRLYVNPDDCLTNRYLSYVGVDPFAAFRSIEGQMELNPDLKIAKDYTPLELNPKEPYCMGSNGFMFRRKLTEKVDYSRDVEFIARMANRGFVKFVVVSNAKIWHKNVNSFWRFLAKRISWTKLFMRVDAGKKREFNWLSNKPKFFKRVILNMLFFPNVPVSIKKCIEYKDTAWLLHAPLTFISTGVNIFYSLFSLKMLRQIFG